jgi:hypothetical protein
MGQFRPPSSLMPTTETNMGHIDQKTVIKVFDDIAF